MIDMKLKVTMLENGLAKVEIIIAYRRNPDGTVTIVLRKGVTAEATGRSQRVAYCRAWDLLKEKV